MSGTKDENNIEQQDSGTKDGKTTMCIMYIHGCIYTFHTESAADVMNYFKEGKTAIIQIKALEYFLSLSDDSGEQDDDTSNEEIDDQTADDGIYIYRN